LNIVTRIKANIRDDTAKLFEYHFSKNTLFLTKKQIWKYRKTNKKFNRN